MTRIQFSADGVNTDYTLVYNPVAVDVPQARREEIKTDIPAIEGESIIFTPNFDSRRGKLIWKGYPDYYTSFWTQINTYIEGFLDTETWPTLYMRMNEIGTVLGVYATYTKIKAIAVNRTLREGGSLTIDTVEFVWENAE